MNTFSTYLQLGIHHIMDLAAIDHMVFILSFVMGMSIRSYKKALFYVTAFTLGHSVTLALATLKIIQISVIWVEFLIPVTILLSTINTLFQVKQEHVWIKFSVISFFGLIHGLGFSNYLQSLLGQEASIFMPLLSFNMGVELGQLIVVTVLLFIMWLLIECLTIRKAILMYLLSAIITLLSLQMIIERMP